MGSIYKRGRTYWIKYYRNGKPYRESTQCKVKDGQGPPAEVKRRLKLREGQIVKGEFPGLRVEKVGFEELAKDFLNDYRVNGKRSLNRAERSVRQLKKHFEGVRVVDITTDRINDYIVERREQGKSNATINRELAALKRMLSLGAKCTPPKVVHVPYVPHLTENNVRTGFFEYDEYVAVRNALPDYLNPVIVIGYYSGMREGEILNLRWLQVDLISQQIILEPGTTKNKKGRIVPLNLNPELYQTMVFQKDLRDTHHPQCPWVCFRDGHKIKDFRGAWAKACKATGLEGKLFHDLRRTAIRNMIRAGISERVAMEISGHRTRAVFDRYNIVDEKDIMKAGERLSEYHQKITGTILGTIDNFGSTEHQPYLQQKH